MKKPRQLPLPGEGQKNNDPLMAKRQIKEPIDIIPHERGRCKQEDRKMYDAYEKKEALENVMRLIERCRDEIAGMRFIGLENDLDDLMASAYMEKCDQEDEIREANREQEKEQERDYYAAVI